jgi:hypothetical protein
MEAAAMEAAAMEGVAMEAAVTEGMGVAMEEAVATEEVVDMEVAVIMVMAATAVILNMTTAINVHAVCLAEIHLSWHLMDLLSFYLTQIHSKNFKFNIF